MHQFTRAAASLAAAAVSVAFLTGPSPAQATTFNIPRSAGGTAATADVFNHQVRLEIDRAKPGALVMVSTYGLSSHEVRDAILRAHDRRVRVRVLSWSGDTFAAMPILQRKLGKDRSKPSWAIRCKGSCAATGSKATHHLKVVTNSTTGRTIVASGNLTGTGDVKWNEFTSFYDPQVRATFEKWLQALAADRKVKSPKTLKVKGARFDFLPGGPDNRAKEIAAVDCRPYRLSGKTVRPVVYVASMIWTDARDEVAVELGKAKRRGCTVAAAISAPQTEPKVKRALRKYGVPVVDTYASKVKMHAKSITIRSKKVNRVITGTTNLGGNGSNTNVIVTLDSTGEVAQHVHWFQLVTRESKPWK